MKLFSEPILSWQEPAAYSYRLKNLRWSSVIFFIATIAMSLEIRSLPWLFILNGLPVVILISLFPWLHNRWPTVFSLTGPRVTLYEGSIIRQNGKSQVYLALENIAQCQVSKRGYDKGAYFVFVFTIKKNGFKENLFGVLTETAISDDVKRTGTLLLNRKRDFGNQAIIFSCSARMTE